MFNTDGLTSLFGRLGKSASNSFMPQERYEIPQESFMPFPQEGGFKTYADGGSESPILTGGVSQNGGFEFPTPSDNDVLSGGLDLNTLTSMLGKAGGSLGSLLGGQQQTQPQGNVYNQMMPSPMQQQQMLPMMQNTFVPQTQMQNFQPYSLLNRNLG